MPLSRSGLPGATISPCSRCTSRTTATSRPREDLLDVGQRVLAGGRVEQVRAGQVAQPVAQGRQPAERADVRRGQVTAGSSGRSPDAARSRTRSCEPIATIVPSISSRPRSSPISTSSPGVMALQARRYHQQSVRPHQRRQHAAATGKRRGHQPPPTRPRRTRTQSSMPIGEAILRASRARVRGGARHGALEVGQQRRGEDLEGQRRRHRIARRAEHRRGVDRRPSTTGCPGRTATPCTASTPSRCPDLRRCSRLGLRSSPATMISRSHEATALETAWAIPSGSSGSIGSASALQPTSWACAASISELVSSSWPGVVGGRWAAPRRRSAAPRRPARRRTTSSVAPAAAAAATSTGPQPVAFGQQQLGGADVLADRPHVLVRRHGGTQLRPGRRRSARARA